LAAKYNSHEISAALDDLEHDDLYLWSLNDSTGFGGFQDLEKQIKALQPIWVIGDPHSTLYPGFEKDRASVAANFATLRSLMAEYHFSYTGVHHIRKPSTNSGADMPESLDSSPTAREWLQRAVGSGNIVNASDVRIGFDRASSGDGSVIVRGFERTKGEFPWLWLGREHNEDGEPVAYRLESSLARLKPDDRAALEKLPQVFTFSEAKAAYGAESSSVVRFLQRCMSAGCVLKVEKGYKRLA
jgi:hypothetical protein